MRRITLTFDNGPAPAVTRRVLRSLDRHRVKATFFVVASRLEDAAASDALREAHADGHWIGNHTLHHTVALGDRSTAAYAAEEIDEAQRRIAAFAHPEKLFRPYGNDGLIGPHLLSRAAVERLLAGRYTTVLWTSVPQDWRDPAGWVDTLLADVDADDWTVAVLHDIPGACVDRLDEALDRLRERNVVFEQGFPDRVVLTRAGEPVRLDPSYISD